LSVRQYPINVKTTEPIGLKFCVRPKRRCSEIGQQLKVEIEDGRPVGIIFRKRTNYLVNNYENNLVFLKKFTLKTRFKREKYRSMADELFLILSTNGGKSLPLLMFA